MDLRCRALDGGIDHGGNDAASISPDSAGDSKTPRGTSISIRIPTTPDASTWCGARCKHRARPAS
jgi:hypothetical protein